MDTLLSICTPQLTDAVVMPRQLTCDKRSNVTSLGIVSALASLTTKAKPFQHGVKDGCIVASREGNVQRWLGAEAVPNQSRHKDMVRQRRWRVRLFDVLEHRHKLEHTSRPAMAEYNGRSISLLTEEREEVDCVLVPLVLYRRMIAREAGNLGLYRAPGVSNFQSRSPVECLPPLDHVIHPRSTGAQVCWSISVVPRLRDRGHIVQASVEILDLRVCDPRREGHHWDAWLVREVGVGHVELWE